ncbi:MAG TPA: homoserine kinase [Acidimicrobiia bacterium]|nr:homoserine kinase [Acidimicrobiia bacterium]
MITASAPASSANLGPGFDVLALALAPRCRVSVEQAEGWEVVGASGSQDDQLQSIIWGVAGASPPHRVEVSSDIPIGKGLGSSAALRVATAAALEASGGEMLVERVFRAVAIAEGHSDNAAAAVFGGLVAVGPLGEVRRLAMHPSLVVVVAIPEAVLPTAEARAILSTEVSRGVAVRTAARVAFLVEGLRTADPDAFREAAGDEIHEAPRRHLSPVSHHLAIASRAAGALHAAWSGAGPAVLAVCTEERRAAVQVAMGEVLGESGEIIIPAIDREGVRLE